ncbi:MAG TPA: hypothetical protein VD997_03190 [Phycisphaerales bacterium]|nr:hypothetical protein [Phycisphaerales bacterium]
MVAAVASAGRADNIRWINTAGGNFEDPANWETGQVPGAADTAVFDLIDPVTIAVNTDAPLPAFLPSRGDVTINAHGRTCTWRGVVGPAIVPSVLRINGGTFTLASGAFLNMHPNATLELNGASVSGPTHTAVVGLDSGLRVNGGALVIGSLISGQGVIRVSNGGTIDANTFNNSSPCVNTVTGPGSLIHANTLTFRGVLSVLDGALVHADPSSFSAVNCAVTVAGAGSEVRTIRAFPDTSFTISAGGRALNGYFEGPVNINAGAEFVGSNSFTGVTRVAAQAQVPGGAFFGRAHLDDASFPGSPVRLTGGLTLDLDGLSDRDEPLIAMAQFTLLSGSLIVNLRNANALRVSDAIPLVAHPTYTFSSAQLPTIGGGRVLAISPPPLISLLVQAGGDPCWSSDFNGDGDYGTDQDIEAFFACIGGACCATCASADFNSDGDTATDQDIESFFRVLGGHPC